MILEDIYCNNYNLKEREIYPTMDFVIHEDIMDSYDRVEYLNDTVGKVPMKMNFTTHAMNSNNSFADWKYLKKIKPCMAYPNGKIAYYLDPDDYNKKEDGTQSDVANQYSILNAMVVIPKIYKKEWKDGNNRYVSFCEIKKDEDYHADGFDVLGKEREYMLIPMFYGALDNQGRMRSLSGMLSYNSASNKTTDQQNEAIKAMSGTALFFGGGIINTINDLCILLTKSTNSQESFGYGMCNSYVNDPSQNYGTKVNAVVNGGMFYGSNDKKSFNKIFHSCVLGSMMLWQRDPYQIGVNGLQKVSPDYKYDLTGDSYVNTGVTMTTNGYYATTKYIEGFGDIATQDITCSDSTGYCDHTWVNNTITAVSIRFGGCVNGLGVGLWARDLGNLASDSWWSVGASLMIPSRA